MKTSSNTFFELLFQENYDSLVRFLSSKVRDSDEAQDLAQDAFYKVMSVENAEKLEHVRAYLFQTASNLALNRIRKRKHQEAYKRSVESNLNPEREGMIASPERAAAATEQLQQVERVLNGLPRKCRRAFLLHRTRHLSYQQIAEEMGISVSTVEKYMIRALGQCRKKVQWDSN
ncbi:MAG: RNA polymerase sigma-70 factor (family 1) [Halieaceae bacterium]|jgi:RNA polymerase sigma-70 factor (family 1)